MGDTYSVGDKVILSEFKLGGSEKSFTVTREGIIVEIYLSKGFVVVDNGLYKECVWVDHSLASVKIKKVKEG